MTALQWDKPGERSYQTGIDRGVLYLHDGTSAVWNGLTSVTADSETELTPFYVDGVKYLQAVTAGDYVGKLKAFTYPDEFDSVNGIMEYSSGLSLYDQTPKSFNLSYRTRLLDDLSEGNGYKIHLLYNLIAVPDSYSFETMSSEDPVEFGWTLTGTPDPVPGYKPTVHVSIDSRKISSDSLFIMEKIFYGTDSTDPRFPSLAEVTRWFNSVLIIDLGDGTWEAVDVTNRFITMIDSTTFQIDADAEYLDADTYEISTLP